MDFWNNPIVVSAMRLRYRRSSPGIMAAVWAMALLGLGIVLHYIALRMPPGEAFPVARTYLLILFSVHFLLCAVIALVTTTGSMNAEVTNRTLDFQRIVSLSPQTILVGKMIGEPAVTYFLIMASVPFAVLAWANGGGAASEILFLYVNLVTFVLMSASIGLIHSLNPPAPGSTRQRGGAGAAVFAMAFIIIPQLLANSGAAMNAPVLGEVLQLVTPLGALRAFWDGSAWSAHVSLWGLNIPSLLFGPVAQLGIAAWIIAAMSRRLKNPVDPALTKRGAYATVAVLDLVLAAICFAQWRQGASPGALVYGYCFGHVIASLLVAFAIVPRQTAVLSWIWRRRPRRSPLREMALADRSPISLAAVILGLIGPAVLAAGYLLPMYVIGWPNDGGLSPGTIGEACVVTVVLVTAMSIVHQLFAAVPKKGGNLLYFLIVLALNVLPPITAALLDADAIRAPRETQEAIASLSPAGYYIMNMSRWAPDARGGWLVVIYLALAALSYRLLARWLRRQTAVIDGKLQSMSRAPAAHPA
jgi:hypothetical protein